MRRSQRSVKCSSSGEPLNIDPSSNPFLSLDKGDGPVAPSKPEAPGEPKQVAGKSAASKSADEPAEQGKAEDVNADAEEIVDAEAASSPLDQVKEYAEEFKQTVAMPIFAHRLKETFAADELLDELKEKPHLGRRGELILLGQLLVSLLVVCPPMQLKGLLHLAGAPPSLRVLSAPHSPSDAGSRLLLTAHSRTDVRSRRRARYDFGALHECVRRVQPRTQFYASTHAAQRGRVRD